MSGEELEDRGLDSGWQDLRIPHGHGGSDAGASLSSQQHPPMDGNASKQGQTSCCKVATVVQSNSELDGRHDK
jgi:hypothetical protein